MPRLLSKPTETFSLAIGAQKLGQPVPDSNFVLESKGGVAQEIQRYKPSAWLSAYLPVKARSVPLCRATWNWIGVSCGFHAAAGFCIFSTSTKPLRCPAGVNSTILTVCLA